MDSAPPADASDNRVCADFTFRNDPVWTGAEEGDPDVSGIGFMFKILEQGGNSAADLQDEDTFTCDYFELADYLISREVDVSSTYARLGRTGTHAWDGTEHRASVIFGAWFGSMPYDLPTFTITGQIDGFLEASRAAGEIGDSELRKKYLYAAVRVALTLDEGRDMISEIAGQERRRYSRDYRFRTTGLWPDLGEDGRAVTHANDVEWASFVAALRTLYQETVRYGSPDERWKTAATELIRDYLAQLDCYSVGGEQYCGYYPHEYRDNVQPDPTLRDPRLMNAAPCNGTSEVMRAVFLALGFDDGGHGLELDTATKDAFRDKLAAMVRSIDATKQGDATTGYYWYQTERSGAPGGPYAGAYSATAGGGSAGIAATLAATSIALSMPGTVRYFGEAAMAQSLSEGAFAFVINARIEDEDTGGYRWHVIEGCEPSVDADGVDGCAPSGEERREWTELTDGDYTLIGKCRGVMPIAQTVAQLAMVGSPSRYGEYRDTVGKTVTYVDALTRAFHGSYAADDDLPGLISPWSNWSGLVDGEQPKFPGHLTNLSTAETFHLADCALASDSDACGYAATARTLRLELFRRTVKELRCQDQAEGRANTRVSARTNLTDCARISLDR